MKFQRLIQRNGEEFSSWLILAERCFWTPGLWDGAGFYVPYFFCILRNRAITAEFAATSTAQYGHLQPFFAISVGKKKNRLKKTLRNSLMNGIGNEKKSHIKISELFKFRNINQAPTTTHQFLSPAIELNYSKPKTHTTCSSKVYYS